MLSHSELLGILSFTKDAFYILRCNFRIFRVEVPIANKFHFYLQWFCEKKQFMPNKRMCANVKSLYITKLSEHARFYRYDLEKNIFKIYIKGKCLSYCKISFIQPQHRPTCSLLR